MTCATFPHTQRYQSERPCCRVANTASPRSSLSSWVRKKFMRHEIETLCQQLVCTDDRFRLHNTLSLRYRIQHVPVTAGALEESVRYMRGVCDVHPACCNINNINNINNGYRLTGRPLCAMLVLQRKKKKRWRCTYEHRLVINTVVLYLQTPSVGGELFVFLKQKSTPRIRV